VHLHSKRIAARKYTAAAADGDDADGADGAVDATGGRALGIRAAASHGGTPTSGSQQQQQQSAACWMESSSINPRCWWAMVPRCALMC
jgi:hypothetical protein